MATLPVAIGVVGASGLVGATVVKQILHGAPKIEAVTRASVKIVGVTNSRKMAIVPSGLTHGSLKDALDQGEDVSLESFGPLMMKAAAQSASAGSRPCAVLVDCTASEAPADQYLGWLQAGCHVVTPNKKWGAGDLPRYLAVKELSNSTGRQMLQEASVGAGLPVMSTLKSLVETGDQVLKVEGILSGTLSYIFNTYKPGMSFSQVVRDAKAAGYTEPDPREDLSGMDVARKVAILAREAGLPVTLDTLKVDSLVPEALAGDHITPEEYLDRLHEFDAEMAARADAADAAGQVIRYVGCVDVVSQKASVTLTSYPKDHPFAQLSGTDNILVFTTQRYSQRPLIVRGPGAGAEVTAMGVLTDIIQAIRCHGSAV